MESILWARIAAWGGALLLTFIIGFVLGSSGGDGVSRDAYEQAVAQRDDAEAELRSLRTQAAAALVETEDDESGEEGDETESGESDTAAESDDTSSSSDSGDEDESDSDSGSTSTAAEDESDEPATGGQSYTAKEGDTWWAIAQQFYGDGAKYTIILKANGLGENAFLAPGTSYVIPPADSE